MIDTVIFDIGNVLIQFDWNEYVHMLFHDAKTEEAVTKASFGSGLWNEMDRGLWDAEETLRRFIARAPEYEEEIRTAFNRVGECTKRTAYAIPWIQELQKQGYPVLYLSNYSRHVMSCSREALDFLPYMDGGIFSCDVHSIKPEPEIYQELVRRYQLKPEHCVFLDDNPNNIEEAKALGFHAIQFQNYEQAHAELERVLDKEERA